MIDRMAENEVIFREYNERVQRGLIELKELAQETDQTSLIEDDAISLHFYCECSDENCLQRIIMKPNAYRKIHKKRNAFIVIPGHEVPSIETITHKEKGYAVVEKFVKIPQNPTSLNRTPLTNT
jgi:hypothetical protein